MDNIKLISLLIVSVVLCAAEPPVNTYLPASRTLSAQHAAPATLSSLYGPPSSRRFSSSQNRMPSNQYGAPGFGVGHSGVSNSPSTHYGSPSLRSSSSAHRYASSSFPSFAPSSQYGAPSGKGYSRGSYSQGDDMSEPANYQFSYDVSEPEYGVEFGHTEARQGDNTKGTYYVLLPDGRRQRVDYIADLDGYKPTISYENTGAGRGGAGVYSGSNRAAGYQQSSGYQTGTGPY